MLNWKTFDQILDRSPRLLVLMCHGVRSSYAGAQTKFSFEDDAHPYIADAFDEDRLITALQGRKKRGVKNNKIGAIVLSTCHSERLGKIMLQCIQPPPAIIAIHHSDKVSQWATSNFNKKFIEVLIENATVKDAYEAAQRMLEMSKVEDNKICCCQHNHTYDCLFAQLIEKEGRDAVHEKFCYPTCDCYYQLKMKNKKKQVRWGKIKEKLSICHQTDCLQFDRFYKGLTKNVDSVKLAEMQDINEHFLKKCSELNLASIRDENFLSQINFYCCCHSDLSHRESDKFIIVNKQVGGTSDAHSLWDGEKGAKKLQELESNLNRLEAFLNDKIFESVPKGKVVIQKPDFSNVSIGL